MGTILDEIVWQKRREIAATDFEVPSPPSLEELGNPPSFAQALQGSGIHIIAEIKYRSPSHGPFAIQWPIEEIAQAYRKGGAVAFSVLTDREFFSGDLEYLCRARKAFPDMPCLRKDFILDRRQVRESRRLGASAYLLIAACLAPGELRSLIQEGSEQGLEALVEVHDLRELEVAMRAGARVIGVNNRDLRTFRVDLKTSFRVARELEGETGFTLVSESGLSERSQLLELRDAGFQAFLIGSVLMDSEDPRALLQGLVGGTEFVVHKGSECDD